MSVEIDPVELGFRRPFTNEVSQILKVRNATTAPIAFKVKTTAPKQYCVRPNSGRIEPDHDVEVTVLLQAMKQDPPSDVKCRDKFLVQSVPITSDKEFLSVQDIWDSVEKSAVLERKIRVNFLPADGNSLSAGAAATPVRHGLTNGVESTPDAPPAYSSPREHEIPSSTAPTRSEPSPDPSHDGHEDAKSFVSGVGTTVASVKDTTVDTLKEKLAQAEAMISSLKAGDTGLRQRKGAGASSEGAGIAPQIQQTIQQVPGGVSVGIVAALCLLSFLLAYFFF